MDKKEDGMEIKPGLEAQLQNAAPWPKRNNWQYMAVNGGYGWWRKRQQNGISTAKKPDEGIVNFKKILFSEDWQIFVAGREWLLQGAERELRCWKLNLWNASFLKMVFLSQTTFRSLMVEV
jgi:hypothetical protein